MGCRVPLNDPYRRAEESTGEVSALGRVPPAAFSVLVRAVAKAFDQPAPSSSGPTSGVLAP
jgi:hypothetical protein